jgi:hypothetical protein
LSLAAQTIHGADIAVSAGFSAAGKVVDFGKKLTEGTKLTQSVDKAQAKLNTIQKKKQLFLLSNGWRDPEKIIFHER